MKFNWGTGIAAFYSLFVIVLVLIVFKSRQYDHSLVSEDYYADDLNYQNHYEKLMNSKMLEEDLRIWNKIQQSAVELKFPSGFESIQGEIHFFCPSKSNQDFRIPVRPGPENIQIIPTKDLKPGLWKVKVDWKAGGKSYFKEEAITI